MAQDPLGGFNLTLEGTRPCIKAVMATDKPTLFLGGGGYNKPANSAKYWTYLTSGPLKAREQNLTHDIIFLQFISVILGMELSDDIPDEDRYFSEYGPCFEMSILKGRRPNRNSEESLSNTVILALGE